MSDKEKDEKTTVRWLSPDEIFNGKRDCAQRLTKIFSNPTMEARLLKMVGSDASRLAKLATAFISMITEDKGAKKRIHGKAQYFFECSLTSLTTVFMESVNMQLPFDSRQLVAMVIYGWDVELEISYKGFVNALNRHYTDAFVECKLVFLEDHFESEIHDRLASYTYKPKNAFAKIDDQFKGIAGGYCFFSYTDKDGGKTSRLVFLSRDQILANKARARSDYVWKSDPKAMGEKTCIREGAKLPFAAIDMDVDIEEVDNRHYILEKPESKSGLLELLEAQKEIVNGKPEVNPDEKNKDQAEAERASGDDKDAGSAENPQAKPQEDTATDDFSGAKENTATADKKSTDTTGTTAADNGEIILPEKEIWDGKTVFMGGGKSATKDFASPRAAAVYVKKVVAQRTHNSTRKAILDGNAALMNALKSDGEMGLMDEMELLTTQGKEEE